jgi:hypothetical protein
MDIRSNKNLINIDKLTVSLVFFLTIYNALLCIINTSVYPISNQIVTIVQATVFMLVFILYLRIGSVVSIYVNAVIGILVIWLTISMFLGNGATLKSFFDVLVYPVIFYIGLKSNLRIENYAKYLFGFLLLCFLSAIFEMIDLDTYTSVFNVSSYYLNTRDWAERAYEGSTTEIALYVGALRPTGTMLGFTEHRVSGIFLDPLTFAYFLANLPWLTFRLLSRRKWQLLMIVTCFFILATDTRTSFFVFFLFVFFELLNLKIKSIPIYVYPLIGLFVTFIIPSLMSGEIAHRLSQSSEFILQWNVLALLGFDKLSSGNAIMAYLGFPLLIFCIFLINVARRKLPGNYLSYIVILISFTFLLGSVSISAKIASLIAFTAGYYSGLHRRELEL